MDQIQAVTRKTFAKCVRAVKNREEWREVRNGEQHYTGHVIRYRS